jgi:peroxiredoxin
MSTPPPADNTRRTFLQVAGPVAFSWVVVFVGSWIFFRDVSSALIGATLWALLIAFWKPLDRGFGTLFRRSTRGCFAGPALGFLVGAVLGGWALRGVGSAPAVEVGRDLELAGPTLGGEEFDLRRLRGKVVLLDFWATWCRPCRAELPNVRDVYRRYHGDGLEVVGVSLDTSRDELAQFVEQQDVPWPQVFFDKDGSRGFDNPLARACGVEAIPCTLLIDPQGRVAQVGLRGQDLGQGVARLLGKEPPPGPGGLEAVLEPVGRFVGTHLFVLFGVVAGATLGLLVGGLTERLARRLLLRRA